MPTHVLNRDYTEAVGAAGGLPLLLTPIADDQVASLLSRLDGLVLSGGGDIDPTLYGAEMHESMYGVDPERDRFELALVREAARRKFPTLAICRGMQIVNVALGGTLIVDIPSEVGGGVEHARIGEHVYERHQTVQLVADCQLATVLSGTEVKVNSIHHQAIRQLAPGLHAVGEADDGIIEAVESDDPDWPLLAVQWHPEYLSRRDVSALRLFAALVDMAGESSP